ncbi:MAG: response regulator [Reichenbachiella sp.]
MADVLNRTYKQELNKKYRILYVDDEEVNLRIFERAFKRYYEVFTAINGQDAIKLLQDHPMDLIMTDQRMPNMTGVELLLKIVPKYPNIVRMIMTGFSDEGEISKVDDEVGLDRFLVKPWNKDDLKDEFDKALRMRNDGVEEVEDSEDRKENQESLDLVESTLSLVEFSENQELKTEINNLVEATKSKKRPEFVQGNTNDLLNLKESLMPIQQELKLYLGDSVIVYDHRSVNKNGYWFGEIDEQLVVASFHVNADAIQALSLNTFISAMMTEMVYKERKVRPDKLISELSSRIDKRFIHGQKIDSLSLDICVVVIDRTNDVLFQSGFNHDLIYYDDADDIQLLNGSKDSLIPGQVMKQKPNELELSAMSEIYLIPINIINEANEGGSKGIEGIKPFLEEIHKYPMSMQSKLFDEYHYKSLIGLRI